jgi:uncharacterized repeat protein (TIGR01451 family)
MSRALHRIAAAILAALACACVMGVAAARAFEGDGGGSAGAVISNRAEATYDDPDGTSFSTVSTTIFVTVKSVSSLRVTPDESAPSESVGPRETVTRVFRVCNLGNTPDLYTITRAEVNEPARITHLYFDVDQSGTVTSADTVVNVGTSLSPRVPAGSCLNVLVVIETNDAPAHSSLTIRLGARSNVVGAVNGRGEDEGVIINGVGVGARVTSPDNSSLPPTKLVNDNPQAVVSPGLEFTYTIRFRNSGDVTARDVLVSDDLPAEISYVADSLRLEERPLTDTADADEGTLLNDNRRLEIRLSEVAPDQVVRISFKARLTGNAPAGVGVINGAVVSGQNLVPTKSTTAVVVVDPFGVVFSGRGGSAAPIAGASVAILLDQDGANPLQIPAGLGFIPNTENVNPYPADGQGHFSFAFRPDQLGSASAPARYFMKVTARGYITRMLELTVRPTEAGLFAMSVRALDGQPLAKPGGFELVNEDTLINNIAAVALNIPMFEQRGLEINKNVDKPRAEIGDALTYRVEVNNPTASPVRDVTVRDVLPESFHYAEGTARLTLGSAQSVAIEPEVSGNELTFRLGEIAPGTNARSLPRPHRRERARRPPGESRVRLRPLPLRRAHRNDARLGRSSSGRRRVLDQTNTFGPRLRRREPQRRVRQR